jgi:large subunit ribosomal protein L5
MAKPEEEKPAKGDKHGEKPAKGDKPPRPPKGEKGEGKPAGGIPEGKVSRAEKAEKAEAAKAEAEAKGEKTEKAEKPAKGEGKKDKKGKGGDDAGEKKPKAPKDTTPAPPPRLYEYFKATVRPGMKKHFNYPNDNAVPKVTKVVLNMGVGKAKENPKMLEALALDLGIIAGQRPQVTFAKTSIANFKLREGVAIGAKVTLRRNRMYEFLDRLLTVAVPRIRDFRGLSPKQFDGRGNYSMGLTEQIVFPEIQSDKVEFFNGMNVCVCTNAKTDNEARELLRLLGFPFRGLDVVSVAASMTGEKH